MRISDWSSDVCSSDLVERVEIHIRSFVLSRPRMLDLYRTYTYYLVKSIRVREGERMTPLLYEVEDGLAIVTLNRPDQMNATSPAMRELLIEATYRAETRSEEPPSELQSLKRSSYVSFGMTTKSHRRRH